MKRRVQKRAPEPAPVEPEEVIANPSKADAEWSAYVDAMRSRALLEMETRKGLLPDVLTWSATLEGRMPELGSSGLPGSLEADVPTRFRYWTAKSLEEATRVRDALVEAQLFTPETVQLVDSVPRRVVVERAMYLAKDDGPSELVTRVSVEELGASFVKADAQLTVLGADVVDALDAAKLPEFLAKREPWLCVVAPGSPNQAAVRQIAKASFAVRTRADTFATSAEVISDALVMRLEEPEPTSKGFVEFVRVGKADAEEERYVLGVVLEPDPETDGEPGDRQKDVYDAATVRKSAHRYMREFQNVGLMHKKIINGLAVVVESWVAPVEMTIAGRVVKAGSWLMGFVIDDDAIWAEVKSGKLTGLSIGGDAVRTPATPPAST